MPLPEKQFMANTLRIQDIQGQSVSTLIASQKQYSLICVVTFDFDLESSVHYEIRSKGFTYPLAVKYNMPDAREAFNDLIC